MNINILGYVWTPIVELNQKVVGNIYAALLNSTYNSLGQVEDGILVWFYRSVESLS
jgi:hypothetical protein